MRIFYLTELLSPYRIEWMNLLSRDNEVTAYYISDREETREQEWLSYIKPQFATRRVTRGSVIRQLPSRDYMKRLKEESYDVYVIDGYSSPIKLKTIRFMLKRKKWVYINIDGIDVWRPKSASDIVKNRIKRYVFRSGASFLCGSRIAAQTVIEGGADAGKVHVHPFTSLHDGDILTCEQKRELQKAAKQKLGQEDKRIALAVGRFIPLKQYDRLIEAWKGMPGDCFLYIIGGGEERSDYERLIQEQQVQNIALLDFMLPEKLADYFRAADVFVHPSRTETWGLVINEAMANACPVISTDHCVAAVELIADGAEGYVIPASGLDGLHEKMRLILTDDKLRGAMSAAAIARIRSYTYENLAETHLEIFSETAG